MDQFFGSLYTVHVIRQLMIVNYKPHQWIHKIWHSVDLNHLSAVGPIISYCISFSSLTMFWKYAVILELLSTSYCLALRHDQTFERVGKRFKISASWALNRARVYTVVCLLHWVTPSTNSSCRLTLMGSFSFSSFSHSWMGISMVYH